MQANHQFCKLGRPSSECLSLKRDIDMLKKVQCRAAKVIKGLEHPSCEERQRELELFILEKRKKVYGERRAKNIILEQNSLCYPSFSRSLFH